MCARYNKRKGTPELFTQPVQQTGKTGIPAFYYGSSFHAYNNQECFYILMML